MHLVSPLRPAGRCLPIRSANMTANLTAGLPQTVQPEWGSGEEIMQERLQYRRQSRRL
jgi:hypothetical protein